MEPPCLRRFLAIYDVPPLRMDRLGIEQAPVCTFLVGLNDVVLPLRGVAMA